METVQHSYEHLDFAITADEASFSLTYLNKIYTLVLPAETPVFMDF